MGKGSFMLCLKKNYSFAKKGQLTIMDKRLKIK